MFPFHLYPTQANTMPQLWYFSVEPYIKARNREGYFSKLNLLEGSEGLQAKSPPSLNREAIPGGLCLSPLYSWYRFAETALVIAKMPEQCSFQNNTHFQRDCRSGKKKKIVPDLSLLSHHHDSITALQHS